MKFRSLLVAAALAVVPLTAACQAHADKASSATSPSAKASPQLAPREALAASVKKATAEQVAFEMKLDSPKGSMSGHGQADVAGKKMSMSMEIAGDGASMSTDFVLVGSDVWFKFRGLPGLPDKWMHIAADKLPADSKFRTQMTDPTNASALTDGVVTIERDSATALHGTIDMSKAADATGLDAEQLGGLTTVPFTATLDAEGRLVTLVADLGAMGKLTASYKDYGKPVTVSAPPAADVIEAPDSVLGAL